MNRSKESRMAIKTVVALLVGLARVAGLPFSPM
jgi:hypothetical protein